VLAGDDWIGLTGEGGEVFEAFGGLCRGAALDGKDDVARALLPDDADDAFPVEHAFAAGAADRGTGDLAAFGVGVGGGDILGVEVDEAAGDMLEPGVDIVAAEVGVAGVEVDSDRRGFDQVVDAVEAVGVAGVLGMGLEADFDVTSFSDERGLLEGVFDEDEVFGFGGPFSFNAFVGVDDGHADFGGHADGEFDVFAVDIGSAEGAVGLEAGDGEAGLVAGIFDAPGIIEHRDGVEVTGLAHELTAEVDHGFEERVAHICGGFGGPFERLVGAAGELGVEADMDFAHDGYAFWVRG
jgi:hypothetical protein